MTMRKLAVWTLAATIAIASPSFADGKGQGKGKDKGKPAATQSASDYAPGHGNTPPGHGGTPPGLAKKGGLPPGLAKKFGSPVIERQRVYVAFDPRREDRAWVLNEDRWVEYHGFDAPLRIEVHEALRLPAIPRPPVPPPIAHLHVVLFGS
jgi:hypothetical protein